MATQSRDQEPLFTSGRNIGRRYVRVPGDQRQLLEREDSWSEDLRRGARGMVNVPAHVLEDLKASHSRKRTAPAAQSSSPVRVEPAEAPQNVVSPSLPSQPPREEESDASQMSWSPSPRPQTRDGHGVKKPLEEEPQSSPPLRRVIAPAPSRSRFLTEFPPSSAGEDGDLEMEIPMALAESPGPSRNLVHPAFPTMPEPTPPSAQVPVISSTTNNEESSQDKPPPTKRSKLMKPIKLEGNKSPVEGTIASSERSIRLSSTMPERGMESSITDSSTPSILANNTQASPSHSTPIVAPPETQLSASILSTHVATSGDPDRDRLDGQTLDNTDRSTMVANFSTESLNSGQVQEPSHDALESENHEDARVVERESLVEDAAEHTVAATREPPPDFRLHPFARFMWEYKDYKESRIDFLRACLLVEHCQKARTLPSFLFDDFIRSFKDFVAYIKTIDESGHQNPLSAIQWYNENVDAPMYTKGVVTKYNLDQVLERYEDDIPFALGLKEAQTESASQGSESQHFDPTPSEPETQDFVPVDAVMERGDTEHRQKQLRQIFGTPRAPEPMAPASLGGSGDVAVKIESDYEEEMEIAATPSLAEIATQPPADLLSVTQLSPEQTERIPETVVRTNMPPPRRPAPRPSAVSIPSGSANRPQSSVPSPTGSAMSRASSRSRRSAETPEDRIRRFRKFLEKRKQKSATPSSSFVEGSHGEKR